MHQAKLKTTTNYRKRN